MNIEEKTKYLLKVLKVGDIVSVVDIDESIEVKGFYKRSPKDMENSTRAAEEHESKTKSLDMLLYDIENQYVQSKDHSLFGILVDKKSLSDPDIWYSSEEFHDLICINFTHLEVAKGKLL